LRECSAIEPQQLADHSIRFFIPHTSRVPDTAYVYPDSASVPVDQFRYFRTQAQHVLDSFLWVYTESTGVGAVRKTMGKQEEQKNKNITLVCCWWESNSHLPHRSSLWSRRG
jgi:hypothetical protein